MSSGAAAAGVAISGIGAVLEAAFGITSAIAQMKQANAMEEANKIQADWVKRQEEIIKRGQDLTVDLALNGQAYRAEALSQMGFNSFDVRRMMGSSERNIMGSIDMPVLRSGVVNAVQQTSAMSSFASNVSNYQKVHGRPRPPRVNYTSNPPRVTLGPRPPTTSL